VWISCFGSGLGGTNHHQVLLLLIELQRPLPPTYAHHTWLLNRRQRQRRRWLHQRVKFIEPTSNGGKNHTRSLASAFNGVRHAYLIGNTLICLLSGPVFIFYQFLCRRRRDLRIRLRCRTSLRWEVGHSPRKPSASLGRATAGVVVGVVGSSGTQGEGYTGGRVWD